MIDGDKKGPEIESLIRDESLLLRFKWAENEMQIAINTKLGIQIDAREICSEPYTQELKIVPFFYGVKSSE